MWGVLLYQEGDDEPRKDYADKYIEAHLERMSKLQAPSTVPKPKPSIALRKRKPFVNPTTHNASDSNAQTQPKKRREN